MRQNFILRRNYTPYKSQRNRKSRRDFILLSNYDVTLRRNKTP